MDKLTNRSQNLNKLIVIFLTVIVGVLSGLGVVIFQGLIGFIHNLLFLGKFSFIYNANLHTPPSVWGVGVILLPIVGAPFVTWLIEHFAYDEKGLSVPEVMYSLRCKKGLIRPKVALTKTLTSCISIGAGGSVGREGPTVQLGSALGSLLSDLIRIPVEERTALLAAGAAASTAAIFSAPISGIIFVFELLLIPVNFFNILLLILATYIATSIEDFILGPAAVFTIPNLTHSIFYRELFFFIPFGILIGISSIIFIRGVYWFGDLFAYLFKNPYLRHMIGMSLVGGMLYFFMYYFGHYYIDGIGYSTIQDVLHFIIKNPWVLFLLLLGKWLATCLTLGSGASGGIFSPSLFLGAVFGALIYLLFISFLPTLNINIGIFVAAGMAGMLGSVAGTAITAIVLIFEMIRTYHVILPLIITVVTAYGARKWLCKESVYTLKLYRRGIHYPSCNQKIEG